MESKSSKAEGRPLLVVLALGAASGLKDGWMYGCMGESRVGGEEEHGDLVG